MRTWCTVSIRYHLHHHSASALVLLSLSRTPNTPKSVSFSRLPLSIPSLSLVVTNNMDSQDHKNSTVSTGHENHGVHLCHRCGWPFPNPHPSARHRRAHKKVCGTLEGYKLTASQTEEARLATSDESDDDHRTPSPKIDQKQNIKEPDSTGGRGEKSNRSEDEVFTDAVSEFSESGVSPILEKRSESVSDKIVEEETIKQLNDSSSSSQTSKLESSTKQLESIIPPTGTSEAVSVGFTDGLKSDPIKSNIKNDIITDNINEDGDKNMQQELVSDEQLAEVKMENAEAKIKSSETVTLDSEEGKTSDVEVIVVDREEKLCDKVEPEVVKHEIHPQKETTENTIAFAEVKQNADLNGESDDKLIEVCKSETGEEQNHVLSVNSAGVDNTEVIIEEFKDHNYIQSKLPQDLSSDETTRSVEADNERTIVEESLKTHSVKPAGSLPSSSLASGDFSAMGDNIKVEADTQELQLPSVDSSHNANVSDTIISSMHEEVKQETDVCGSENADKGDVSKSDEGVNGGNERSNGDSEDILCVDSKSTPDYADKSSVTKGDQTTITLVDDSKHDDEKPSSVLLDAGNRSEEVGSQDNQRNNVEARSGCLIESSPTDISTSVQSVEQPISGELAPLPIQSESLKQNSAEENSCAVDGVVQSEPIEGNSAKLGENQDKPTSKEQESMPTSAAVENNCQADNGDTVKSVGIDVASENHSPISISKEQGAPSSDPEVINENSGTVDDKHITQVEEVARISVEPLQGGESDDKLTKQKDGDSLVFISGASSSPAESVEGNWGSVLSSQSDLTTVTETNSRAAEKSGADVEKHDKTIVKGGHSHQSDDFEPPSFGTLVQSAERSNQKGSSSEIEIAQNAQQPKSEALPQGWFPSITNVVNESEGRKKNEEAIAKVTSWSSGKQHSPLKNLLSEAKSPNPKQVPPASAKAESAPKDNGRVATTMNSTGATSKEMEDWNSPARYPVEIKKEKKKGKPYWVPFVCCSSVHSDL